MKNIIHKIKCLIKQVNGLITFRPSLVFDPITRILTSTYINGQEASVVIPCCETEGTNGFIYLTNEEINLLIMDNNLIEGFYYMMTDFETIYDQPDFSDNALPFPTPKSVVVTKTGPITPILLFATSSNTFAKEVCMPSRPDWKFEYDINFTQTEKMLAPAKGRITYAKDNFGNETTYDHDVVLFKRYDFKTGVSIFTSFWDNGEPFIEVKTFKGVSLYNTLKESTYIYTGPTNFVLPNNVFGDNATINTLGFGADNNTFGDSANSNVLGNGALNNILGNSCAANSLTAITSNLVLGNNCYSNTFKLRCKDLIIFDNARYNTFEERIQGLNFEHATHIYQSYPCRIFKRLDGTARLSYVDNSDALVVVNPAT